MLQQAENTRGVQSKPFLNSPLPSTSDNSVTILPAVHDPVAVSHAADRAPAEALVPMIQGLLLINSLGSALGPMMISPLMNSFGANGLFWVFALINMCMVSFFLWRRGKRPVPANPAPFAAAATFSATDAVQVHPPMVDALSGEPATQCESR